MQEQANFMRTCSSISQGINKLQQLGDRNWTSYDINENKYISNTIVAKPKTALEAAKSTASLKTQADKRFYTTTRSGAQSFANRTVRVFSPQHSCYIEQPAHIENEAQRLTYCSMRSANNSNSIQVCGHNAGTAAGPAFDSVLKGVQTAKPYTVSAETFHSSWVDGGRAQTTTNYESARFNIINHGNGSNSSVTKMIKDNPKVCHKVKSISEFTDLANVAAPKPNKEYQESMKKCPSCFVKSAGLCSPQIDFGKTYGPFFKLFKK